MANAKISALTSATTPLAGTEVLPIVQSSATVKVATNDLTVRNVRAAATTGILQVSGPAAASTRTMTVPDANFTAARTDAAQTFTGLQTLNGGAQVINGQRLYLGPTGFTAEVYYNANGNLSLSPRTGYDTQLDAGNLIIGTSGKGIDFSATSGTGTSELLADYEEGTWTPTPNSGTFSSATGRYTKVGRTVTLQFNITVGTGGGTNMSTAPFTCAFNASNAIYTEGQTYPAGATSAQVLLGNGGTTINFVGVGTVIGFTSLTLTAGAVIIGCLTYTV